VESIVENRETAEALKPWYNQFCKRPCFHDEYLPTFNRPSVHLVDTKGEGVERITEDGVVVAGREYSLDCLIYATGFEVGAEYTHTIGFQLYGRDGRSLGDKWKQGAETMHSMFTRGFPNCFVLSTMQSGQSANFQHMLDEKAKHIAFVVREAMAQGVKTFEPSEEAEREWVDTVVRLAIGRRAFLAECTPGYYNNEGGELDARIAKNNQYWRGPVQFVKILDRWRKDGTMPGLERTW
jgi:cyclohexanone monooxygenase